MRVALALLALLIVAPAEAGYVLRTYCSTITGHCYSKRVWVEPSRNYRYRLPEEAPRHYYTSPGPERGDYDPEMCRDRRRAVGDQHLTIDGAKKAANDAWAGQIRFHLGEKFIDLQNARGIVYTCSRSSIKEGGVTTLGQTFTRCEVEARPCLPPKVHEEVRGDPVPQSQMVPR